MRVARRGCPARRWRFARRLHGRPPSSPPAASNRTRPPI